ncbi:hypothetical protein ACOMCU_25195 [Lysinibacillus sp. UGB7]|uniref:hypothetical protein n=1 Tax=Lysinibacillus sp. UGB7 TaxID=3411039 RepID=UPI003B81C374
MLVNDLTLAKIAVQMGYQPFVAENQELRLSKTNWITDYTVLNDFITDYNAAIATGDSEEFQISEDFFQKNKKIINRAIKKEATIIIAENSCFGKGFLTEEIISRVDLLEFLISSNELKEFKEYIASNNRYNPTFEKAKGFIEEWIEERPIDYIGLLVGRLITKDYEQYFQCGITGDASIQDARSKNSSVYSLYETNQDFGGTAIRIAEKAPSNLNVTFELNLQNASNNLNHKVAAWQLTLAGFVEKEPNKFEFNATRRTKN